jgi:hypothetical protein
MTRSNLHIKLSNGKSIICVADSSSAPEQGYIVEQILLPLLSFNDSEQEWLCYQNIAQWMKGEPTQRTATRLT